MKVFMSEIKISLKILLKISCMNLVWLLLTVIIKQSLIKDWFIFTLIILLS